MSENTFLQTPCAIRIRHHVGRYVLFVLLIHVNLTHLLFKHVPCHHASTGT
jgi:hypothetical protein